MHSSIVLGVRKLKLRVITESVAFWMPPPPSHVHTNIKVSFSCETSSPLGTDQTSVKQWCDSRGSACHVAPLGGFEQALYDAEYERS